jgi:anti-sigma regulatory factor (Ser/Thr protein kinase)
VSAARSVTLRLQARPDAAAEARRAIHEDCQTMPGHLLYDAELLTTEVVTNSVKHARGMITVAIECDGQTLAVAVGDDSPLMPTVRRPRVNDIGGRGMQLVDRLAASWGTQRREDGKGKLVWFRIAC